jgi:conjugal transfer pilus assembly protein TraU
VGGEVKDKINIFLKYWSLNFFLIERLMMSQSKMEIRDTKTSKVTNYHNIAHFALIIIIFLQSMYIKMRSMIVERNEKEVLKGGHCEQKYCSDVSNDTKVKPTKTSYEKSAKKIVVHAALIVIFFLGSIPINLYASESKAKRCKGEFINPITDICWECLFPITIGSIELKGSDKPNTKNPNSPVCLCIKGNIPLPGITGGFWEPARMTDISQEPYCFVNLGGMKIDMGMERGYGARPKAASAETAKVYVHYYIYPLLLMLNIFTDVICLERVGFDLFWTTELDPTADDELSILMHPEAFLFNNPVSQAACAVDCIKTSLPKAGLPIDALFWCNGCQGTFYPMNGSINYHNGGVSYALSATGKIIAKMHRTGLGANTSGTSNKQLCEKTLAPVIKKSQYRYQLINPDSSKTCYPLGSTTSKFEAGKEIPVTREDFGYLIWQKRNCCIL